MYISCYCVQTQLSSSHNSLATAKDEIKQLHQQLKSSQQISEATISNLKMQHEAVVKSLEKKVCSHYSIIYDPN